MIGTGFPSFESLENLIRTLPSSHGWLLPPEIATHVADFFTVKALNANETRPLACSSTSGQYGLEHCLIDSENSWWISAQGSFRNGKLGGGGSPLCHDGFEPMIFLVMYQALL
jgi:hypothetical protein